ncbi:expressed unknown protein [Seminavis robusta]|uniref:Uncharacterized protein n=1 Tax=Seminavis robusta TaxID=568900 RepID=A0A9N8EH64_9STRA|nr:expressed unknown protein [Seminavis robusta]|eukprot:Sro1159_g247610.1 n/a (149) ;mRNA; r:20528-20974
MSLPRATTSALRRNGALPSHHRNGLSRLLSTPAATSGEEGGKIYKQVVAALDAPMTKPPPASEEEMQRRYNVGRSYVIGMFERHNEEQHMMACRIKLKNHAVDMLPKHLRASALEEDDEGPPLWRHIPMWTPPIPGFDPDEFMDHGEK